MASRAGATVTGTDGSDFYHRETIASHYKASVTNKWRLKCLMFTHLMLILMMATRLSTSFLVMMEMRPPAFLQKLRLPRAQTWEFVWLATLLPMIFGYIAIRKNKVFLLQQYLIGNFVFGVLPALFGLYFHFDDLMEYWETKSAALVFRGFPVIVLWYMFLVIAMQLHSFEIYFSYQLLRAWNPNLKKRK